MRKRTFLLVLIVFAGFISSFGAQIVTYEFANKDSALFMDVYMPSNQSITKTTYPCIIYVFGGGFIAGSRLDSANVAFCKTMCDKGFVVAAIDYRLGLKGKKMNGLLTAAKNLEYAIHLAVEDLFSSVSFILNCNDIVTVDTSKIILMGSSAGAITVLQADYELGNRTDVTTNIPESFHFAGVVSFAGAVFSRHGLVKYKKQSPAPTLFFHGTADKLVNYDKTQFANIGFFGSNALEKRFAKFDYPYYIFRYADLGHEVAGLPQHRNIDDICWFIENMVFQKQNYHIDKWLKDDNLIKNRPGYSGIDPANFYK